MITHPSTFQPAISRRMLVFSLLLHGCVIVAVIAYSYHAPPRKKPEEPKVLRTRIVAVPQGAPDVMKLEASPKEASPAAPLQPVEMSSVKPLETRQRSRLIEANRIKPSKQAKIRVNKRKRPLQTVAAPPPKPKDKEPQHATKKEDPERHIKDRIAEISNKLKEKSKAPNSTAGVPGGSRQNVAAVYQELQQWFARVREQINAHWAVIRNVQGAERATIVGVDLSNNGSLLNTTVVKSSGDRRFDTSALRAVYQAAPFPSVPPKAWDLIRDSGGLQLRFTTDGLR